MKTKRTDDWMEQAEKLGQHLAQGLEAFGDRVAKAIEAIETKVGPQLRKAAEGLNLDDQRPPAGHAGAVENVGVGDVFELERDLYMRLGALPGVAATDLIDTVHLSSGQVRQFPRGTIVVAVDATLVVKNDDPPSTSA